MHKFCAKTAQVRRSAIAHSSSIYKGFGALKLEKILKKTGIIYSGALFEFMRHLGA